MTQDDINHILALGTKCTLLVLLDAWTDDLALNRKMIETLLAQAILKSEGL